MSKRISTLIIIFLLTGACSSHQNGHTLSGQQGNSAHDTVITDLKNFRFSVSRANRWTSIFKRNSGWFGGDGIFSVALGGDDALGSADKHTKTLLWFSDTMVGDIVDSTLQPGYKMIHNSVAILDGNQPENKKIHFYWDKDKNGQPKSIFIPHTPASSDSEWYWLGDGFVNKKKNGDIYIFAYRIKSVKTGFGFALSGSTLIMLPHNDKPPFKHQKQMDTPLFIKGTKDDNGYAFGAGVFVNTRSAGAPHPDGYVYVYGVKTGPEPLEKDLMVARVLPENITDFNQWRFWDGKGWNLNIQHIREAATITDGVSDELSFTPLPDGRYALVFQDHGIGSTVELRLARSPKGPFGPKIKLWDCPEVNQGKDFYTYNAKAYPHLSPKGELLISYNVNAFHFFDHLKQNPFLYRPRFIKLKFE